MKKKPKQTKTNHKKQHSLSFANNFSVLLANAYEQCSGAIFLQPELWCFEDKCSSYLYTDELDCTKIWQQDKMKLRDVWVEAAPRGLRNNLLNPSESNTGINPSATKKCAVTNPPKASLTSCTGMDLLVQKDCSILHVTKSRWVAEPWQDWEFLDSFVYSVSPHSKPALF